MGFKLSAINTATRPEGKKEFEPLAPGLYIANILEAKPTTASTGTEYVKMTLEVKDFEGNFKGKLWHNLFLTEKNAWNVGNMLAAVGCPIEDADDDAEMSVDQMAKVLEGGQVCIHTKLEENNWNGKVTMRPVLDVFGPMAGVAKLDDASRWYDIIVNGIDPDAVDADEFINAPEDADEVEF